MSLYDDIKDEKTGVLIAGRYNKEGKPLKASFVAGDPDEIKDLNDRLRREFAGAQGEFVPSTVIGAQIPTLGPPPKKRGRKPKVVAAPVVAAAPIPRVDPSRPIDVDTDTYHTEPGTEPASSPDQPVVYEDSEPEPIPAQRKITFQNNFGKVRLEVEDVIHQNNFGLMLVFSNDDKLSFIPNVGENLKFSENGTDFATVYFPGSLFNYYGKIMMVLFNAPDTIEGNGEENEEIRNSD